MKLSTSTVAEAIFGEKATGVPQFADEKAFRGWVEVCVDEIAERDPQSGELLRQWLAGSGENPYRNQRLAKALRILRHPRYTKELRSLIKLD